MSFHSSLILLPGTFKTTLGNADYFKLPKVNCYSQKKGQSKRIPSDHLLLACLKKFGVMIEKNEFAITLLQQSCWSRNDLEDLVQILFEKLNIPALYIIDESVAALYGTGSMTGLVVDLGHTFTTITPIYDNNPIYNARQVLELGGKDVTDLLTRLHPNQLSIEDIEEVKQHTRLNPDRNIHKFESVKIKGKMYGDELAKCGEVLFDPSLVDKHSMNVVEAMILAVNLGVEPSKRLSQYENIILVGGTSQIQGLQTRLEFEIQRIMAVSETSNEYQPSLVKFVKIPDYMSTFKSRPVDTSFLGGTIVSKIAFGAGGLGFITKHDYNTYGPKICVMK